jgi:hypothetical protein
MLTKIIFLSLIAASCSQVTIDINTPDIFLGTWSLTNSTFPELSQNASACFPTTPIFINSTTEGLLQLSSNLWMGAFCPNFPKDSMILNWTNTSSFLEAQDMPEPFQNGTAINLFGFNSTNIDSNTTEIVFSFEIFFSNLTSKQMGSFNFQLNRTILKANEEEGKEDEERKLLYSIFEEEIVQ